MAKIRIKSKDLEFEGEITMLVAGQIIAFIGQQEKESKMRILRNLREV